MKIKTRCSVMPPSPAKRRKRRNITHNTLIRWIKGWYAKYSLLRMAGRGASANKRSMGSLCDYLRSRRRRYPKTTGCERGLDAKVYMIRASLRKDTESGKEGNEKERLTTTNEHRNANANYHVEWTRTNSRQEQPYQDRWRQAGRPSFCQCHWTC